MLNTALPSMATPGIAVLNTATAAPWHTHWPCRRSHCFVGGCHQVIGPALLMCRAHWELVPKTLRKRMLAHWRLGQTWASANREWKRAAVAARAAVGEVLAMRQTELADDVARRQRLLGVQNERRKIA